MLGCSHFELARSILYNAHLLARGIRSFRACYSPQDRSQEELHKNINEPASELDQLFVEARILLNVKLEDEQKELKARVDEIYLAITRYSRELKKPDDKQDRDKLLKYDAIIWSSGEDDPFTKQVDKAVEHLTQKLQPFIAKR